MIPAVPGALTHSVYTHASTAHAVASGHATPTSAGTGAASDRIALAALVVAIVSAAIASYAVAMAHSEHVEFLKRLQPSSTPMNRTPSAARACNASPRSQR
jgi:hypothetical protein